MRKITIITLISCTPNRKKNIREICKIITKSPIKLGSYLSLKEVGLDQIIQLLSGDDFIKIMTESEEGSLLRFLDRLSPKQIDEIKSKMGLKQYAKLALIPKDKLHRIVSRL